MVLLGCPLAVGHPPIIPSEGTKGPKSVVKRRSVLKGNMFDLIIILPFYTPLAVDRGYKGQMIPQLPRQLPLQR